MRKCQELATALAAEYAEKSKNKRMPKLILSLKDKPDEGFSAKYSAGKLSIHAGSLLAQTYAICHLGAAINAGHLPDSLGENHPRFPLRPLWLKALMEVFLTDHVTLHLPEFMLAEDAKVLIPRFCKRLIECGYNSVLIGTHLSNWKLSPSTTTSSPTTNLEDIFQQLHDHGIKIILKPNFAIDATTLFLGSPQLKTHLQNSFDALFRLFPKIDAFFWESLCQTPAYLNDPMALDSTDGEIALTEIKLLEHCLQNRSNLIFYIPSPPKNEALRQARWITKFVDEMGVKSLLSFNAVSGSFYDDHSADHPLWELLRTSPDVSSTALLPIINIGLVKQGEGLWPITNFDLLDRFVSRCYRHHFEGAIGLISHIPESGSLLDCNLWVAGQTLWRDHPPFLIAETWFKAFRPAEDAQFSLELMKIARGIVLQLSLLRSIASNESEGISLGIDEAKIHGESILSSLKKLKLLYEKQVSLHLDVKDDSRPSIKEYFSFFAHDVKQLLGSFLPTFNLPLSHVLDEEESQISFWSHELEIPHRGHKNSTMEAIYLENRYL